ncbi:uncharacterized protein BDR25DRAFT_226160 [Lindgomyces ingoldianus]|uniref:Uncharacterized protein n=1 Tax=Lindgomyces ingoldianus TaxID=673940 RepID=A0ACB6QW45_9PLEO|nr:uncharacterized protein BDR25DRAFT_226160 [Lindgomyces ingoldianus]KAF2470287.1 hypothetical protein BDR25DRAFT_226160 [Lindgomyces ingoldianus]
MSTPFQSAEDQSLSPTAGLDSDIDPLVIKTAKKLADVINDLKRELDGRDGTCADVRGTFKLSLDSDFSHTYELSIAQDEDGVEYPITIHAKHQKVKTGASGQVGVHRNFITPLIAAASSSSGYVPARRVSDAELEKDIVSRRKRKLDEDEDTSRKRPRTGDEEDVMPLITKDDLEDILSRLRDDIQEDTSECVNHVQKLLRRFKEEWHEKSKWDYEQVSMRQTRSLFRDSIANGATPSGAFPSPSIDKDDSNTSLLDMVRQETRLLSSQIRWVEECRRVAAEVYDKREETWRTTSAGFHDRNRVDRESFQNSVLQESVMHGRILTQILNEVKALGHVTMSLKWETPDHMSTQPTYPPAPTVPAFSTQPAPTPRSEGPVTGPSKR